MNDSAAPDSFLNEPEPIWFGTNAFADSPEILIVPKNSSENVRISGAVEPESSRLASPLSTNVAR